MEFKSWLKVPGGGEVKRCFYPIHLDTYGCGCGHNCLYCYARSVLGFRGLWRNDAPSVADRAAIEKVFVDAFEKGRDNARARLLRSGVPMRLGGMTDCFTPTERESGTTLWLLGLLKTYRVPYLILTKSDMVAEPSYLDALDPDLAYVQFSITTPYDDVAVAFEPGAPPTSKRLNAAKVLADAGFYTAIRVNPLVPLFPDHTLEQHLDAEPLRYFGWELVDMAADAGFGTFIAGFLRLSSWNVRWILEATGQDWTRLFAPDTKQANTALHFSTEEKRSYYERLAHLCKERGMAFSVCYDGDEDYETFRYLWANHNDCCNGLGNVKGFAATWQNAFPSP